MKQDHLRALALADLILTGGGASKPGRPEYVVVIDTDTPTSDRPPQAEFSIPVEVPWRVLAELAGDADVHTVVVRNGVVLHAPGNLNLGPHHPAGEPGPTPSTARACTRRVRSRAAACATTTASCITSSGGATAAAPTSTTSCRSAHGTTTRSTTPGWNITLGPNRELTIRLPRRHRANHRTTHHPSRLRHDAGTTSTAPGSTDDGDDHRSIALARCRGVPGDRPGRLRRSVRCCGVGSVWDLVRRRQRGTTRWRGRCDAVSTTPD